MATATKTVLHYFVAIDDNFEVSVVGTSKQANGPKALILFADKRYGVANWDWKICSVSKKKYIVSRGTGECLSANAFPEWM